MPKVSKSRKAKVEEPWSDVAGGSGGAVDKADANNGFNVNITSTDDQPLNFTNVPSLPPVHHGANNLAAAAIGGGAKEEEDNFLIQVGCYSCGKGSETVIQPQEMTKEQELEIYEYGQTEVNLMYPFTMDD